MIYNFDTGPMIAYLRVELGGALVRQILSDPANTCYAYAINLCEVYYDFLRITDEPTADSAIATLIADGVVVRDDMDEDFWKSVGRLKARGRISIADCFCIALAQRIGGTVVTTDHHEFDALVPLNLCPIQFIR